MSCYMQSGGSLHSRNTKVILHNNTKYGITHIYGAAKYGITHTI